MLWYCAFTWFPGTTREAVAKRFVQQHDAGDTHPDHIKGWYNLAGGGSGFLMLEASTAEEVTALLQPYMDLMSWDVRAVTKLDYKHEIDRLRQVAR